MGTSHEIKVVVEGATFTEWQSGNIETNVIQAADTFVIRCPFSLQNWNLLRRDARITIKADEVTLIEGFIDKRKKQSRSHLIEVEGRDRVGRLTDESAPAIDYSSMDILEAIKRLAAPWFQRVTLSNARNRRLRRGKGKRLAAPDEPEVLINIRVPRQGRVHPGQSRWQIIHEICSRAQLCAFSSSDGRELVICRPTQQQQPEYMFVNALPGSTRTTNVRDLTIVEDDGERYSSYLCSGAGGQGDTNYGSNVIDNRGVVFDNPLNRIDGTGRDFLRPKRMHLPEKSFETFRDAQRVAELEQARRDFKRHQVYIESDHFGQSVLGGEFSFFTTDSVALVIDEDTELVDKYWIFSNSFSFSRDMGDTTNLHMVPVGTTIVQ